MGGFRFFAAFLLHFSHSVRMDVSAHFSALDDEEFFVVEGSGRRGRRESDSHVFCRLNSVDALASTDKHDRHTSCPLHNHHNHHTGVSLRATLVSHFCSGT